MSFCCGCNETFFKVNDCGVLFVCTDWVCGTKSISLGCFLFSDPLCGVTELDPATHVGKNPCNSMWFYHSVVSVTSNSRNQCNFGSFICAFFLSTSEMVVMEKWALFFYSCHGRMSFVLFAMHVFIVNVNVQLFWKCDCLFSFIFIFDLHIICCEPSWWWLSC